ncbi:uncharacterized protein CC84DRAFT_394084 [Paraphaeosphaeria sporulosa]|uniref:DNA/RNA-binding domain-containing protein n=1 Tax=Paraphaeosphaeria sporulosa TaxID=1460663 RepID=A0A177BVN8_9PLEO|nr:uncharacterized protein CC84DRAFT_394084 [Paraphaeosphaeria sporulosa]OAF99384.1 hypothetical protein CC84DRAFT_394084 [Paraphaeosphaeria sporulosa]
MTSNVDLPSRWVTALRTQAKTADAPSADALSCPYCEHSGRIFQTVDQLYSHAKVEHASLLDTMDPETARAQVQDAALRMKGLTDQSSDATAGGGSTPDITALSLEARGRLSPSGRKRPADSDLHVRRGKAPVHPEIYDEEEYARELRRPVPERTRPKPSNPRLYDPKQHPKSAKSPYRTPEVASEWSVEANRSQTQSRTPQSTTRSPTTQHRPTISSTPHRSQPGLIELQRYDSRYPGLLLQPDSRPISQEQLASEVKSIYAGLTMVETKCIHVDRAQAAALQDGSDPTSRLASDHWQALIALHRTLLHEHHDFFLASQHPSASPALRRLAAKYSMPARMWKHGIHSFLELLRRRLPESIDYMLAFIYLAYQMMALLYETVPAFEDTWIECLGDLGRYRMAIEDENPRDRETWAGVARSWYSKAADKNPSVGRLYHHLAILARPNALRQLYYYARSLTCVKPFPSARESILTLLDPMLSRPAESYSHDLPIDTSFIQAHGILFGKHSAERFEDARFAFQSQLDNHIGRVTAKWKEQGVYIAVTNLAGLFNYGSDDSILRQILILHDRQLTRSANSSSHSDEGSRSPSPVEDDKSSQTLSESEVPAQIEILSSDFIFSRAYLLTMTTLTLVLRRIGDKNVLPHVHVLLAFISTFASIKYVAHFNDHAPWTELVSFLNTLLKSEQRPERIFPGPVFPADRADSLPLPEDYLIRGQIWSQWYFPEEWFKREHDEEDRSLELASTVKLRTERVLHLGFELATFDRWISYDEQTHTFSVTNLSDSC